MRRHLLAAALLTSLACAPGPAPAVAPVPGGATPDAHLQARLDLAGEFLRLPELVQDSLVAPRWLRDGDRLVFWSAQTTGGGTWMLAEARTGAIRPLLPAEALREQVARALGRTVEPLQFYDFAVAADQRSIVFEVEGTALALGLEDARITALAADDPAARSLSPLHFVSPDGRAVAGQQADGFVVRAAGGASIERAGEAQHGWRIPDDPWSPDGRFLVVWREDLRDVHQLPIVDTGAVLERVTWVPYAKVGTPLPRPQLHVVEPATGRVTPIAGIEGETHDWFVGWLPDGREALCLHLSRDGKRLDLTAVDPRSGKRRLVLREERRDTFVAGLDLAVGGAARQVKPLPDGKGLLWLSERDGWRHVHHYDLDGRHIRQVTRGAFPVHEVVAVDPDGDTLYVLASAEPGAPYEQLLYRGSLRGGELTRMSAASGMHRIGFAPSGDYYVDAWSSRTQPRLRELVATRGDARVRLTTADPAALVKLGHRPPEALTVLAADGVTPLHGALYKPRNFDPGKRYPVIAYIYAGPFTTVVPWSFLGSGESIEAAALAQMGFVVLLLDPRGGPGRSKAFQDAHYGRIGQTEIPDHVAALRQAAADRPWMDLERVGIHGHSWGGYFALRGMLTAPELFKAGYAGAPGALEEEALINEPYLGLPASNPAGYKAGSNEALAARLRGHLKLMHGTADVNAPVSTTMRMAAALIAAGKRFELLIMPGEPHSPGPPAYRYYRDDVHTFFARTLGGPR
ncbi:MAG TPA: DPP IV N-terminal domain-containing protein [Nannocystis sp.]|jgi:dipeptidyl aminopeptidase/acylaminoacyl peptidase